MFLEEITPEVTPISSPPFLLARTWANSYTQLQGDSGMSSLF